ncbi:MAG: crossover junction endodeoxyribonuclease RuvC [Candidatus Latescibacteria bacterium 4484_7]|nr:MAG: crossover junction endodeoxyribonuclease RuvC [Candidatus Latescibacteria bacterium 4484_7]
MSIVLGIDPGSRITGYGIVELEGKSIAYSASGVFRLKSSAPLHQRLIELSDDLDDLITRYKPDTAVLEEIFLARNPKSTMILGEVRGVVLLAAARRGLEVFEYSAREVKMSVVGSGAAHKSQVSSMIQRLLKLDHEPATEDETDALAIAFCHALKVTGFGSRIV